MNHPVKSNKSTFGKSAAIFAAADDDSAIVEFLLMPQFPERARDVGLEVVPLQAELVRRSHLHLVLGQSQSEIRFFCFFALFILFPLNDQREKVAVLLLA